MISVEHLADLTKSKLEPFKEQAEERFEELSALIKEATIQISQWDVDTEANVRIIHESRDKQVIYFPKSRCKNYKSCSHICTFKYAQLQNFVVIFYNISA